MNDIQFGEVEFKGPQPGLRPDENAQYAVVLCGQLEADDLPIFVDLDVMREMELHARTNTNVELGGVMLGAQRVDRQGRPFVLIQDSLRAEHYEATRGSFKFTHETWAQITKQREQFPDDLEMVGWYHTHPDWGVFLSGMDNFICDHFFNRSLDVALVIDPCRDEIGWFQWSGNNPPRTRKTGGFYLMTHRFRADELAYFQTLYSNEEAMSHNPRFSPPGSSLVQPVVNINDQRTPIQNIAIMGMLTIQLLVLALIGYKLLADEQKEVADRLTGVETQLVIQGQQAELQARERAYRNAIAVLAGSDADRINTAEAIRKYELENEKLKANLNGQMALANQAVAEQEVMKDAQTKAEAKIADLQKKLQQSQVQLKELESFKSEAERQLAGKWFVPKNWMIYVGFGIGMVLALAAGYWLGGTDFGKTATDTDEERRRSGGGERDFDVVDRDDDFPGHNPPTIT